MKHQLLAVSFCHLVRIKGNPGAVIEGLQIRVCQRIDGYRMFCTVFNRVDLHPEFPRYSSCRCHHLLCQKFRTIRIVEFYTQRLGTDGIRVRIGHTLFCDGDRRCPLRCGSRSA